MAGEIEHFVLTPDAAAAAALAEAKFAELLEQLVPRLPGGAQVVHIGATAIPGCLTKGDLDIVVRVSPTSFAAAEAVLADLFNRNTGSVRSTSFAAFQDEQAQPPLGIQLTAIGGEFDDFHRFVERLRQEPGLIEAYNDLKRRFDGKSMDDYRAAKREFVATVLRKP